MKINEKEIVVLGAILTATLGVAQEPNHSGFAGILYSADFFPQSGSPGIYDIETNTINVASGAQNDISNAYAWRFSQNGPTWNTWTTNINQWLETYFERSDLDSKSTGVSYSDSFEAVYVVGDVKTPIDGEDFYKSFIAKLNANSGSVIAAVFEDVANHAVQDVVCFGDDVFTTGLNGSAGGIQVDRRNSAGTATSTYSISTGACFPRVIAASTYGGQSTLYVGGKFTGTVTFASGLVASTTEAESPFLLQLTYTASGITPVGLWFSDYTGKVSDVEVGTSGQFVFVSGAIPDEAASGATRPLAMFDAADISDVEWMDTDTSDPNHVNFSDSVGVRSIGGFDRVYTQAVVNGGPLLNESHLVTVGYVGPCKVKSYRHVLVQNINATQPRCLSLDSNLNLWFGGTILANSVDLDPRSSTAYPSASNPPFSFGCKWYNSLALPLSVTLAQGSLVSGNLSSIACSDDQFYIADWGPGLSGSAAIIETTTTTDTAMSIQTLTVLVEAKSDGSSTTEKVYLYDYVNGSWVQIGSTGTCGQTEAVRTYTATGTLSRFRNGSGESKMRIKYETGARSGLRISVDHSRLHVTN